MVIKRTIFVLLALLLTGFSIADYPMHEVIGNGRIYLFSLMRLIILPAFFLLLVKVIHADPYKEWNGVILLIKRKQGNSGSVVGRYA